MNDDYREKNTIVKAFTNLFFKLKHIFKNKFVSDSKNYLLAELFNKSIVFLTIPIFTRLLSPEEYGILSIFNTIGTIAIVFLGLNFHASLSRKFYEKTDDFGEFLRSNIMFLIILQICGLFFLYFFKTPISNIFNINSNLFIWAIIISIFGFYIELLKAYFQVNQQSKKFLKISVLNNIFLTGLSLVGVILLTSNKYMGKIYSQLVVTSIFGIYAFKYLYKICNKGYDFKHIKYSLIFGIPLIPHALSSFILNEFDKIIINNISGSYETGIYSFAYNIGMLMMVVVIATNSAWVPMFYKFFNEAKYDEINKYVKLYSKFIVFIAISLTLFSDEIVGIMAGKEYLAATKIVPIIILSYVFVFLYTLYAQYAIYNKKTILVSLFTIISGLINIVLNYIYIPRYGYIAAAYTTLISYIILWAFHYINSYLQFKSKIIPFKVIYKSILFLFIYIFLAYIIKDWSYNLMFKIILLISSFSIFYEDIMKRGRNY